MKIQPTTNSKSKKISISKLGKFIAEAIFLSKSATKPHVRWKKHSITVEFVSIKVDENDELLISNLTISESGRARKLLDSTDGVSIEKFIKTLKSIG